METTMGDTVELKPREMADSCAAMLASLLKLKKISMVPGGPSPSDPEGNIDWYMGFADAAGNGFHVGVDDQGVIRKCGATLNGRAYRIPVEETL